MVYPSCLAFNFKMNYICTDHKNCLYNKVDAESFVCVFSFKFNIGYTTMFERFGRVVFGQANSLHFQNIEDAAHYLTKLDNKDLAIEFKQNNQIPNFVA